MGTIASQITSLVIVYWIVYLGAAQRKHQSSVSLAFVRGIHRWPVNSPHKGPVTRKMFPFDDVVMIYFQLIRRFSWHWGPDKSRLAMSRNQFSVKFYYPKILDLAYSYWNVSQVIDRTSFTKRQHWFRCQETRHHLSQWWPISMPHYVFSRSHWVNNHNCR